MKKCLLVALLTSLIQCPVWALNIVLTNDDSWDTENLNVLKQALVNAGHDVILSTPCTQQSGKGGAIVFLKPFPVDDSRKGQQEYCVGDTDTGKPFRDFVSGTPVMAAIYGIDKLALQYWQKKPDLLISGPNEGNNLGVLNNNSGTLGAAMIAISKGIPAIAVSAHITSGHDPAQPPVIAAKVLAVLSKLESTRDRGQPLLPKFTGLNINLPEELNEETDFRFTQVGWSAGVELRYSEDMADGELFKDMIAHKLNEKGATNNTDQAIRIVVEKYQDVGGLSFDKGNLGDNSPLSEANVLEQGFITISTINANVQASASKAALTEQRLKGIR